MSLLSESLVAMESTLAERSGKLACLFRQPLMVCFASESGARVVGGGSGMKEEIHEEEKEEHYRLVLFSAGDTRCDGESSQCSNVKE